MSRKKKVRVIVFSDDARIARTDDIVTASLKKARQRAIAVMRARNSPLAVVDCVVDNRFIVYELIYGTPMGKLLWCNAKMDNRGYSIDVSGIPGVDVLVENMWTKMSEDIAWSRNLYTAVSQMRRTGWSISGT